MKNYIMTINGVPYEIEVEGKALTEGAGQVSPLTEIAPLSRRLSLYTSSILLTNTTPLSFFSSRDMVNCLSTPSPLFSPLCELELPRPVLPSTAGLFKPKSPVEVIKNRRQ